MLTNQQMTAGRYERWARSRSVIASIQNHLRSGGVVIVSTHLRAWQFDGPKYIEYFKASKTAALMRSGKSWVGIDGARVRFGRWRDCDNMSQA